MYMFVVESESDTLFISQVQRSELLWWLGFIKTRNLGQMPFANSPMEQDLVPMSTKPKPRKRLLTAKQMQRPKRRPKPVENPDSPIPEQQNGIGTGEEGGVADIKAADNVFTPGRGGDREDAEAGEREGVSGRTGEGDREEGKREAEKEDESPKPKKRTSSSPMAAMYGSYILPVPVIIVGSHYDQLEGQAAVAAVQQTQRLVDELREQFEEYLDISPQLYALNCLKSVSTEIRALKERLCTVRSKLVDVSWAESTSVCECV